MSNLDNPLQDDEEFDSDSTAEASSDDGEPLDWGGGDLEEAYLKAMMALEASEAELPAATAADATRSPEMDVRFSTQLIANAQLAANSPTADATNNSVLTEIMPSSSTAGQQKQVTETTSEARVTPRQILEACLFVGGSPLASGKLAGVLRGDFDSDFIDREIDELNRLYAAENRPYEIRLGDGGYRLTLRDEFERIRYKVYGLGPKEVRLSQDALEVLAIVAYHQPIRQSAVEEMGKPGCGAVLRQLVRRELLAVERIPDHPQEVNYKTTPRFLSLFGIRNLDELPRHEQVGYK